MINLSAELFGEHILAKYMEQIIIIYYYFHSKKWRTFLGTFLSDLWLLQLWSLLRGEESDAFQLPRTARLCVNEGTGCALYSVLGFSFMTAVSSMGPPPRPNQIIQTRTLPRLRD